jgi:hypothetical protein
MRYEVAQAFIDLSREAERKEARNRKKKKKRRRPAKKVSQTRSEGPLADTDDSRDLGNTAPKPGTMDDPK